MKKILFKLVSLISLVLPATTFAHEQWFAKPGESESPIPIFFQTWGAARIGMVVGAAIVLVVAVVINHWLKKVKFASKIEEKVSLLGPLAPQIVRGAMGILMIVASTQSLLFAPDLNLGKLPFNIAIVLWTLQYAVGFAFVLGLFVRPAAVISALLYIACFWFFPVRNLLSYLALLGIFVYLFFVGTPGYTPLLCKNFLKKCRSWILEHEAWGLTAMRVLFGLTFVCMGIAFKLMMPQTTLGILQTYPLNFIALLGFTSFSNEMFVYAAGLTEVLFGTLYIFNILPRLASFKLLVLFTATIFVFGLGELFGHLPLLAGFFAILTGKKQKA